MLHSSLKCCCCDWLPVTVSLDTDKVVLPLQWADQSSRTAQLQGGAPHEPEGGLCSQAGAPTIAI